MLIAENLFAWCGGYKRKLSIWRYN